MLRVHGTQLCAVIYSLRANRRTIIQIDPLNEVARVHAGLLERHISVELTKPSSSVGYAPLRSSIKAQPPLLLSTSSQEQCWFLRWKDEELSDDDLQANCGDHLDDEGASSDG